MKPISSLILLLLLTYMAQGQNRPETVSDSVTNLDEIVLTERGILKNAKGITVSQRLQTEQLERFGPVDIASSVNQISGVYMLSGALNTNRITIRGVGARTPFSTNKLRMYFNNIPITNGTGTSELEAYDLQNLGAIEVIKGPKGTSFGSNLGGAIILNSKAPEVGSTQLTNEVSVGSYHLFKDNLSFRHYGKDFNLSVSYNHLQTDGYRQNNRFVRDGLLLTAAMRLGKRGKLDVLFNHIDYNAQIPSSLNATDFQTDPTQADGNWLAAQGFEDNRYTLAGLTYSHRFSTGLSNKTSVFYTYLDHYEPRPFNILDEYTNGFGFRTLFEGERNKWTYTLGSELYKDEYHWGVFENLFRNNNGNGSLKGNRLGQNREFRDQFNLFGTLGYALAPKLNAQLGLNYNKTQWDFRDLFNTGAANVSAARDFNGLLLPSLSLRYQLKQGSLHAQVGRGFSNPSLEETLTPDGTLNPDILQETGLSYELGGQFSWFNNTLQLHATLFRMHIENLLVAERIGQDEFIGRNAGETRHQGLELDLAYQLRLNDELMLSPFFSYTLNDHSFIDFKDKDDDFSGNPLTGVPKNRINSGATLRYKKWAQLLITHQFVDEIPLTDANTLNSEAFHLLNLQLRSQHTLGKHLSLGLNVGLNNIFDTLYAQSVLINAVGFGGSAPRYFYPGNGRNYYAGIRMAYSL
ncbi:TonB-dependent receptor family protein [Maribacter sp. 2307ULW6-5]|uniref:TonB-dependent receptor family protein n=1 Tax=Maribacter sp. 2307ULW6-5 TaxID=3386275 RepID=UPI0039BD1752